MIIPLYYAQLARKAWQMPRVRRFALVYLAALIVLSLLQACGGGDPEPDDERVRTPTRPNAEAAQ